MNRNVESHFSQLPAADIQRSTFDRSCSIKTTLNSADVIPFFVDEVLPGDTFDITTAKVIRSQTLTAPVMDNIYLDTYWFFVPNRLVWKHWKEFCGENSEGPWAPQTTYTIPKISAPLDGFHHMTIADYMGLPTGIYWDNTDRLAPTALPFRGYALIMNEFFRDENLSDPLLVPLDDANQSGTNGGTYQTDCANGGKCFRAARYHDYFSSALPAPQKGPPVGIPIDIPGFEGGTFEVKTRSSSRVTSSGYYPLIMGRLNEGPTAPLPPYDSVHKVQLDSQQPKSYITDAGLSTGGSNGWIANYSGALGQISGVPLNLAVEIPADEGGGTVSFSVNEMRLAFAYQRYLESLARSGSRYVELLLGLFGVQSPDARLQRPEYLGGNRISINVDEVTNTAQSEQDFLGDLGAKSKTSDVNHDFVKSFTEHGYLFGLMVVRHDHSYAQGIERFWTRSEFTDFYNPKFANLGEVPIYKAEIFAAGNMDKPDNVFGYQEIWADYRFKPNRVTGLMRPDSGNMYNVWTLADKYDEEPHLSDSWIHESPNSIDRVLTVGSVNEPQFWADIYVANKCTRPMPMYSIPGMIDHY